MLNVFVTLCPHAEWFISNGSTFLKKLIKVSIKNVWSSHSSTNKFSWFDLLRVYRKTIFWQYVFFFSLIVGEKILKPPLACYVLGAMPLLAPYFPYSTTADLQWSIGAYRTTVLHLQIIIQTDICTCFNTREWSIVRLLF